MISIRTDLGPKAAVRLASFEVDGRKVTFQNVYRIQGEPVESKMREYVYRVGGIK